MDSEKNLLLTEEERLAYHLSRTYTERFRTLMRLIKLTQKMKNAKIVYPAK